MLYKLQLAYYKRKLAYLIMAADEIGKPDVNNIFDLLQINQEKERTYKHIEALIFKQKQKQDKYYSKYKKALILSNKTFFKVLFNILFNILVV